MQRPRLGLWVSAWCLVCAAGCTANDPAVPPPPPDCVGPGCNPRPGGGGPGGGSSSPDGGDLDASTPDPADAPDGGLVDLTYTVKQTVDSWFFATGSYGGPVRAHAVSPGGWLTPPEEAGAPLPGTLPNVALGPNWFFLEDATTTRRIASTLQFGYVDVMTRTVDLRGVTIDGLSTLIIDQVPWAPPAGTATIILNFRRAGRPAAGVTVRREALPAGASVAYDSAGMYVSDAMVLGAIPATDVQGTAIVREIPGAQPFPALDSATLRYSLTGSTVSFPAIEAKLARDAVTWMQIDIP